MTKTRPLAGLPPALVVVLGAVAIALGAQISLPMVPVPMTLQTLAVVLIGLLAGPMLGAGSAGLYLACVLVGLPVLSSAQQAGGTAFSEFLGAGYVVGFLPGAAVAGYLGHGKDFLQRLLAGLVCHLVVLVLGAAVLAFWRGAGVAWEHGVLPFLIGAVVKSLIAAALIGWTGDRS